MAANVKPIPDGYHAVTPYLIVKDAGAAIEFYKKALGATEIMRFGQPDGRIGHAELKIGDSRIMLADQYPEMGYLAPQGCQHPAVSLHVYVEDVDAIVGQAVGAGATIERPVKDEFYGDRIGTIVDPFGHRWHIGTHKEDISLEEMERRAAKAHG